MIQALLVSMRKTVGVAQLAFRAAVRTRVVAALLGIHIHTGDVGIPHIVGLFVPGDETVDCLGDLNKIWSESIKNLKDKVPGVGGLLDKIFDIDGMDDIISDEGLATNGFIAFFQRIAAFFQKIADFFRNLFSFGR